MDEDDFGYCPHCGAKLKQRSVYCPDCGGMLGAQGPDGTGYGDPYAPPGYAYRKPRGKDKPMDSTFLLGFIMIAAYAALNVFAILMLTFGMDAVVDIMEQDAIASGTTFEYMYGMTKSEFMTIVNLGALVCTVSAVPAVLSAVLCYMRRYRKLAVLCCGISTLLVLMGASVSSLIPLAIGVLATFFLYHDTEDYFID